MALDDEMAGNDSRTALVFSGGGSLGAVQVGMLQALSRAHVPVDLVVGASVGALNGAFYADDPSPAGADRLAQLWRGLQRKDIFPLTLLAGLRALLSNRDHLVQPDGLQRIITTALRMRRVEDARLALHIMATDVLSGAEYLISSGDMATALLASTAIPVVFPQVTLGSHRLMDGGVSSNTPIASAIGLGAQRIIVLPTGSSCALREPPRNMAALALHVMTLMNMRQLDRDVRHFAAQARIIVVPPLCPLGVSVFDFSQTAALIDKSARQTSAWLAGGGLEHAGPLHIPLAHHHAHENPRA
ncbi:MAG TPA: patatin-like phospholipase family protein [Alicycliphilus sp.]|nr:patatin-like phospholipase family protein [Alicycliphilus sp.]